MIDQLGASRAAVLVPLYKESMTTTEEFSFRTTLSVLSKHDIYVICPVRLSCYLSALQKETLLNFDVEYFPNRYFSSIDGYNHLLTSLGFYSRFDRYEYILVVQTDALVFSDQLEEWCDRNFSYIGAPWFKGVDRPELPLSFLGVGNGGFSLRKVGDFVRVLSIPRYIPNILVKAPSHFRKIYQWLRFVKHRFVFSYSFFPLRPKINEDFFWGFLVPERCSFFSVPKPEEAIPFAFEVAPEYLFELNGKQLPFGCHAWEKYNPQFWVEILGKEAALNPSFASHEKPSSLNDEKL